VVFKLTLEYLIFGVLFCRTLTVVDKV